ncbi:MAG: cell division protein FtsZ [Bacteroidales bacterium]|nr:cell division protein FtsZ [Bacteroidales bacterium]
MLEENTEVGITPKDWATSDEIIKVVGVGGGGCNAVSYMYEQGIKGCSFVVCNTDAQAIQCSPVPVKIQMGAGLGAGTNPIRGRNAALDSQDTIERVILTPATEMLFITAGMGGGTGTGAAPVIAKMAKDKGVLTVGVVTLPFKSDGNEAISRAIDGIHELEKNVDSLLIINNEKLHEFYGDLLMHDAFPKADEVLATAVRGILEIIKTPGVINVDFEDVKSMMKDSGMALMGYGTGSGKDRIAQAVDQAFNSPLLNDFDLKSARNVLVNITGGRNEHGLTMNDKNEINRRIEEYTGGANKFKSGLVLSDDPATGDTIHITAIVTGLKLTDVLGRNRDMGNYIMIDRNFVYDDSGDDVIAFPPDAENTGHIGFNTQENTRIFHFADDQKPVLMVGSMESRAELEDIPAIRRSKK